MAGSVAETALHDLRVNNFGFPDFPQIDVSNGPGSSFTITMRWNKAAAALFQLSEAKAKSAVKKFRSSSGHDPGILEKVQEAIIDLEGKASR